VARDVCHVTCDGGRRHLLWGDGIGGVGELQVEQPQLQPCTGSYMRVTCDTVTHTVACMRFKRDKVTHTAAAVHMQLHAAARGEGGGGT